MTRKVPDLPRPQNLLDRIWEQEGPGREPDTEWVHVGKFVEDNDPENEEGTDALSPPFEHGWRNAGGNAPPVSFYLSASGEVRMRGAMVGGTPGTVAFTLPAGFRPQYSQRFVGALTGGTDIGALQVDPDGKVWVTGEGWEPGVGSIKPENIVPGTDGQILTTDDGVTVWAAAPAGTVPGSMVQSERGWGQTPSVGINTQYSRSDHTHGTPDDPMPPHLSSSDPHGQYQKESEKGQPGGYASVGADGIVPQDQLGVGVQDGTKYLRDDGFWEDPGLTTVAAPAVAVVNERTFGQAATAGTGTRYSREDHTHGSPPDPIPAHVSQTDPHTQYQLEIYKGVPGGYAGLDDVNARVPTAQLGGGATDGTKFLRDDGTWATPSGTGGGGTGGPSPAGTVASERTFSQAPTVGTSLLYARADHSHGTPPDPIPGHVGSSDPHPQYLFEALVGVPSGVAPLNTVSLVDPAFLGSGARDGTKYLRDDGTWRTVAGGAGGGVMVRQENVEIGSRPALNFHEGDSVLNVVAVDDALSGEIDLTLSLNPATVDGYVLGTSSGAPAWVPIPPAPGQVTVLVNGAGAP